MQKQSREKLRMQQTKPASAATLNIDLQEMFIAQRSTHDLMEYSVICPYIYIYIALGFNQKYLTLCSEDERRSYE